MDKSEMTQLLRQVADGEVRWKSIIENFYPDLEAAVEKAEKELEKVVSLNKRGISLYQYNRNKSGIDTEMTEDEKDEADKK